MIPLWAKALIAAVAIGIALFLWNRFLDHQQTIGYDRAVAEYNVKLLAAKEAADKETARLTNQLKEAQDGQAKRDQTIRATAAAAATASTGLLNALDTIRNSVSRDPPSAAGNTTRTLADVFGECQDRYRGLAEKADRHSSDSRTLMEAWPK